MKTEHTEQALARPRVVEGEIVTAEAYNAQVTRWRAEGFSVLTPAVALSSIPRDHKILVNRVQINPHPAGGEVYSNPLFTRDGEVALSKVGLEKIAQCAGISIDESARTDSRTVEHVWSYQVKGHWIGFDGTRIDRVANKTIDLRDGSPDLKGFTPKQIEQARRHGEAVCESKAINRLYRMYGLRQKYTQDELQAKPFIVLKLQWEPDMTNPIVAALVTQQKLGASALMFPNMVALPPAVDPKTLTLNQLPPEMRPASPPIEETDDDPPVATQRPLLQDFVDDAPAKAKPASGAPRSVIKSARVKSVKQSDDDYFVYLDDGRELHTVTRELARACNAARSAGTAIDITVQPGHDGVIEIVQVGSGEY